MISFLEGLSDTLGINLSLSKIAEGAYGEVFKGTTKDKFIHKIFTVKRFKKENLARSEELALKAMAKTGINVPVVYKRLKVLNSDVLISEYINGDNLEKLTVNECNKKRIGKMAAHQIALLHSFNYDYCGYVDSVIRYSTWKDFYEEQVKSKLNDCKKAVKKNIISSSSYAILEKTSHLITNLLSDVNSFSLIHGDLNVQNIMYSKTLDKIYIIDPMNAFSGDREIELFQLNESNGNEYELFKIYTDIYPLSDNYGLKSLFYAALAETAYFADRGYLEDNRLKSMIDKLNILL